ncbi:CHAT domain-containing protein [[Phormidium] sp. ETS-05]|uniref:CHAT domain-containing protein n=1 Tax=[Phormidium] sp. ETS-05 TaxID=222819 RepID=UPI0018EED23B|nr:CHAT domain-containing protein [[Phormidium] sp. ETS-05]
MLLILSYLLPSIAQAQTNPESTNSPSNIIPANDGTGTIVNQEGNQFNITGGQQSVNGANLFHSLTKMGLEPGEIANFISDPKTRNIITRIVGDNASIIDGLIQVTGSNANLFLMNPAGILFGANASLNVPGDFFATTATSIGFAGANGLDERWFNAIGDNDYRQLLGNPNQFAFSGAEPGSVVNFGNLAVSPEHRLTLLGGTVISTGTLSGGQILLQTVPGTSLVRLEREGMLLSLEINPVGGNDNSPLLPTNPLSLPELLTGGNAQNANGVRVEPDGRVMLVGSNLQIENGDLVVKQILPVEEGAAPTVGLSATGGVILQDALETGDLTMRGASASASAPLNATGSVSINVTGTVTAADITTDGGLVTIESMRAIRLGNITTLGGDVLLANTSLANNSSAATIRSRPPLTSSSPSPHARSGPLVRALAPVSAGGVVTGAIDTSSQMPSERGGNVSIATAEGDINVTYINAAGNGAPGDIQVTTPDNFRAVGSFVDSMGNPISIAGGNIQIDTQGTVFQVGDSSENGTTGAIVSPGMTLNPGTSISSGSVVVPPAANPDNPTPSPTVSVPPGPATPSLPTATDADNIRSSDSPSSSGATPNVAPPSPTVPTTPTTVMSSSTTPVPDGVGFASTSAPADDTGERDKMPVVTPQAVTPQAVTPQAVTPQAVTPQAVTPQAVTPQAVTPQAVTPQAVTPPVAIPEVVITEAVTPQAVTPQAVMPPVVIPEVVITEAVTPQAVTPPVAIPEVVTPQVVVPPMVAPEVASVPTPPQVVFTTRNEPDDIRDREFLNPLVLAAGSNLEPAEIDQLRTREFLGYLGKLGNSGLQAVPQEGNIREQMASVVRETDLKPAIIYAISLPEMLELVVVLPDGATVRRVVSAANHEALNALVREFISELTDPLGSRTRGMSAEAPSPHLGEGSGVRDPGEGPGVRAILGEAKEPSIPQPLSPKEGERGVKAIPSSPSLGEGSGVRDPGEGPGVRAILGEAKEPSIPQPLSPKEGERGVKAIPSSPSLGEGPLVRALASPPPGYMRAARQLYDWLIAPIEDELKAARVDTLMFSLDAGMRALPLAALHDGQQFLVEKYRLSLIPSVALTDAAYVPLQEAKVLAMGAAEFADAAVSPLPSVPGELETIARYWQGNTFLNRAFTVGNVRARQRREGYQVLHLATHVQFFPDNFRKSYIQFYDKRLSWNGLQELVWRDKPLELLVLSACETAFADPTQDISGPELGMAGLAAQTGAKSVLASLWLVDDAATSLLMREFYWQLSIQKQTVKAEALRRAQLALLRDRLRFRRGVEDADFSHPYYWAAFTLVGSPW